VTEGRDRSCIVNIADQRLETRSGYAQDAVQAQAANPEVMYGNSQLRVTDNTRSQELHPLFNKQHHLKRNLSIEGRRNFHADHTEAPANPGFNVIRVSTKNNNALVVEIILSLFGLFGVGWLMARENAIGATLLVGSIFIYWPIVILGTIFTLGFGWICLGPFAIGAIILNILLLNKVLDRQSTQYIIASQPIHMHMPPRE